MTDVRVNDTTESEIVFDLGTGDQAVLPSESRRYTFGRYRLIRKLGEGGMATVFLVEQTGEMGFCKEIALKLLHAQLMRDVTQRELFMNEVKLGGLLQHPNLVSMFDCGIEGGQPYYTMEYVDGWSFERILERCTREHVTLPASVIVEIMCAVCDGLYYAHTFERDGQPLNLVHRDIKPANILIGRHGQVKVADFGIAKAASNQSVTQTGIARGTAAYMSPEQTLGHTLDCRSDVFAVAMVLFHALTGKFAFGSDNKDEDPSGQVLPTMQAILRCDHAFAEATLRREHPQFVEVFLQATKKELAKRIASANMLSSELMRVATHLSGPTLREWLSSYSTSLLDRAVAHAGVSAEDLSLFQVTTITPAGEVAAPERLAPPAKRQHPEPKRTRAFTSRPRKPKRRELRIVLALMLSAVAIVMIAVSLLALFDARKQNAPMSEVGGAQSPGTIVPEEPSTGSLAVEATTPTTKPPVVTPPRAMATPTPVPTTPVARATPAPTPRLERTPRAAPTPAPTPVAAPPTFGTVALTSRPIAEVRVDGALVGTTPLLGERLRTGPHTLEFVCEVCTPVSTQTRTVKILEGENPKIFVKF